MLTLIAQTTQPSLTGVAPWWAELVGSVVTFVLMYVFLPWINSLRKQAEAKAAEANAKADESVESRRDVLISRLRVFLLDHAAAMAEKNFPVLAKMVIEGKLKTAAKVRAVMVQWGAQLRDEAVKYFEDQGTNLDDEVGDAYIDSMIEIVANAVSPFPGVETSKALLQNNMSDLLIKKGVDWMRYNYADLSKTSTETPQ